MAVYEQISGRHDRDGVVTFTWNARDGKMLSPGGDQHCLPCFLCGSPVWVPLPVVSTMCDECWADYTKKRDAKKAELAAVSALAASGITWLSPQLQQELEAQAKRLRDDLR